MRSTTDAVVVRVAAADDAPRIAALHTLIAEGFLTSLGPRFLTRLYRSMARSEHSFVMVAEHGGELAGFMAATTDTGRLYRDFLRRDGVSAALLAAPRLVRRLPAVLETLRHSKEAHDPPLPTAELLSAAVTPSSRGLGIGRAVTSAALDELRRRRAVAVKVVIAANNEASLTLHRSLGFEDADRIEVHRGTPSVLLVKRLTDE